MLEAYEQLKRLVDAAEDDVRKAAGGNRAAGTRVRKLMQEVKNAAQALRVKVLEDREGEPGEAGGAAPQDGPATGASEGGAAPGTPNP